jgi:hypothetical protein
MAVRLFVSMVLAILSLSPLNAQGKSAERNKDVEHVRRIVYFGPAQSELDVVSGREPGEALDDFAYYISRADTTVRRLGITTEYNASAVIEVPYGEQQRVIIDRRIQSFGYIFIDGKRKPLVIDYVLTDLDLIDTAKDFFGLK